MTMRLWRERVYPRTRTGLFLWVGVSAITSLAVLGGSGLAVISGAIHGAAWLGDLGDRIDPLIGQFLMVLGLGGALIGVIGAMVTCIWVVFGATVTAVERFLASGS